MTAKDVDELEARFGARIRQVRIANAMSQEELARVANLSRSAISNLESGAGSSLSTVIKVLRALGRADWLVSLEVPEDVFNPLDLVGKRPSQRPKGPARVSRPRHHRTDSGTS